jgi:hypothetical protein
LLIFTLRTDLRPQEFKDFSGLPKGHVPGPWKLAQIQLYDDEHLLMIDQLPDQTTSIYSWLDFDPPSPSIISSVIPGRGIVQGGSEVIIQGKHLDHISGIMWGENPVDHYEILSESSVCLITPLGLTCGPINIILMTPWSHNSYPGLYEYVPHSSDFNRNCKTDLEDFQVLGQEWLASMPNLQSDIYPVEGDSTTNLLDVCEFSAHWLTP